MNYTKEGLKRLKYMDLAVVYRSISIIEDGARHIDIQSICGGFSRLTIDVSLVRLIQMNEVYFDSKTNLYFIK